MNSPPEPGSPSPSTPSSSSPPPEEISFAPQQSGGSTGPNPTAAHVASQFTSHITAFITGSGSSSGGSGGSGSTSKRRFPSSSSFGPTGGARDSKSRRRDDRRTGGGGGGGSIWIEGKEGGKREKEDLVDMSLVELLRKGACVSSHSVGIAGSIDIRRDRRPLHGELDQNCGLSLCMTRYSQRHDFHCCITCHAFRFTHRSISFCAKV